MARALTIFIVAVVAACNGDTGTTTTLPVEGAAASPVEAVEQLRSSLAAGDFDAAGKLAVPEQAILATMAEGASPSLIASSLEGGDEEISANFWSGFAQGAGEVLNGDVTVEDSGSVSERDIEFHLVGVTPEGGEERLLVTRDIDGHRIDLFASFGAGLAEGLISPVELLIGSSSADSRVILAALQDVVPSLLVAATDPSLSPESVQRILQLVELITRVG